MIRTRNNERVDRYSNEDREARVAYVLGRALSLSDELKTTVLELTEMLRSGDEERGTNSSE
jgi:hypothetical protein